MAASLSQSTQQPSTGLFSGAAEPDACNAMFEPYVCNLPASNSTSELPICQHCCKLSWAGVAKGHWCAERGGPAHEMLHVGLRLLAAITVCATILAGGASLSKREEERES
jgi:hypothetical protein